MIYLVSKQQRLFETDAYTSISVDDAIDILRPHSLIQYDSETQGLDPYTKQLLCSQYGIKGTQIVIDNTTIPIEKMKPILESEDKTFLGWNIGFDMKFLFRHGILPCNVWDGMIAERLLYLGYPRLVHSLALKDAAYRYLGINLDKSVRGQIITSGLTIPVIKYAAGDVTYLEEIKEKQDEELKKKDLVRAADFEMRFIPIIAYMEYCGAKIDESRWRQKMLKDKEKEIEAKKKLDEWVENYYSEHRGSKPGFIKGFTKEVPLMKEIELLDTIPMDNKASVKRIHNQETGKVKYQYDIRFPYIVPSVQLDLFSNTSTNKTCTCNIKWSSSGQVIPLLEFLGIDCSVVDKKTKKKKKSCDKKVLEPQAYKCPLVPIFLAYKAAKIQVDTFGVKFLAMRNPVTGRIHPDYFQLGSDTGYN